MNDNIKVSFEIKAPDVGENFDKYLRKIEVLVQWNPQFFSFANHQPDSNYVNENNTYLIKRRNETKTNSLFFALYLYQKKQIKVIPHIVANEFNKNDIDSIISSLVNFDINNFMVLRGDRTNSNVKYVNKYNHSLELLQHIKKLNTSLNTNFNIGVASYPNGHPQSICKEEEIMLLKQKVLNGATFTTTQMFFSNDVFYDFVKRCKVENLNIPIYPGLKLLDKIINLEIYTNKFNVSIPNELKKRFTASNNYFYIGKKWLYEQCKDLINNGYNHLHFYVFSSQDIEAVNWVLQKIKKN